MTAADRNFGEHCNPTSGHYC